MHAINPATLESLGEIPETPLADIPRIVENARRAPPALERRIDWIRGLRKRILARRDEIARAITQATGKPLFESYSAEIYPACALLETLADRALEYLNAEPLPIGMLNLFGRESWIEHRPVGWVLILSPWNFPFSISIGDTATAILSGCSVVLKPSEHTPTIGKLVEDLLGDIAVVHGDHRHGQALIDARPAKVFFTGGVETGKKIMQACSAHLIPVVLELGGKNPSLVLSDADLAVASRGNLWGAFMNSGQSCSAVGRVLVECSAASELTERLVDLTRNLRQGDPMDPSSDVGSLTTPAQAERVDRMVRQAVEQGARVLIGGERGTGLYYPPTLLSRVTPDMAVMQEEIFGPVLPIMEVEDEEQAIAVANESRWGLAASVWTSDFRRARRVASRLEAGTILINECSYAYAIPEAPWGGVKQSGIGRVHSKLGVREFTQPVHVNVNHRFREPSLWWFPYGPSQIDLSRALLDGHWLRVARHWLKANSR